MAESSSTKTLEEQRSDFTAMKKSAFILGYTGESGKALVQELLDAKIFDKIVLIGRRTVSYPEEDKYKCLEQRNIDYQKLDEHKSEFEGCDVGYCCLGTTHKKAGGKEGFYKVDHDYVMNAANIAKSTGCQHFHLVSSQGAHAKSAFNYTKVKGQVEEETKALGFDRVSIYRPAMLMCDREESRPMESLARCLIKPVQWISPTLMTTPTVTLAKAMINATVFTNPEKNYIYDNKSIFKLAEGKEPWNTKK